MLLRRRCCSVKLAGCCIKLGGSSTGLLQAQLAKLVTCIKHAAIHCRSSILLLLLLLW
jgi:hypothetical protein